MWPIAQHGLAITTRPKQHYHAKQLCRADSTARAPSQPYTPVSVLAAATRRSSNIISTPSVTSQGKSSNQRKKKDAATRYDKQSVNHDQREDTNAVQQYADGLLNAGQCCYKGSKIMLLQWGQKPAFLPSHNHIAAYELEKVGRSTQRPTTNAMGRRPQLFAPPPPPP